MGYNLNVSRVSAHASKRSRTHFTLKRSIVISKRLDYLFTYLRFLALPLRLFFPHSFLHLFLLTTFPGPFDNLSLLRKALND